MIQARGRSAGNSVELEAAYQLYCRALRLLIREGQSLEQLQRSLCWSRLSTLHQVLPEQYGEPGQLYGNLRRALRA